MIKTISNKFAAWIVSSENSDENYDVYVYSMEVILSQSLSILITFIFAFIFGKPLEMLVYLLFLYPVRSSLGGAHAKTPLICTFYSVLTAIICVLVLPYIDKLWWISLISAVFSLYAAFFVAPVTHPNKPMSEKRIRSRLIKGRFFCVLEIILITVFYFVFPWWVGIIASLGLLCATISCFIGKYTNHKHTIQ